MNLIGIFEYSQLGSDESSSYSHFMNMMNFIPVNLANQTAAIIIAGSPGKYPFLHEGNSMDLRDHPIP